DHLGDAHVDVVDHHGEVVGRPAVGTEDHQVIQLAVGDLDAALDLVLEHYRAFGRVAEADHPVGVLATGFFPITVVAVVARLLTRGHGGFAHRLDLVLALVGVVRLAGGNQLVGHLPVSLQPPRLVEGTLVGVEVEPVHRIQDRLHRLAGGALPIGILDAQDELAAAAARLQPAIQCGARAADVQETGGTGGEAGAYGHECLQDMRGERMDFSRYRSDHPKQRSRRPWVRWPVPLFLMVLGWTAVMSAWADNPGYDRPGLGFNPATLDAGELTLEQGLPTWSEDRQDGIRSAQYSTDSLLRLGLGHALELQFGDSFYNHLQL